MVLAGWSRGKECCQVRPCAAEEPIRPEPSPVAKVGKKHGSGGDLLLSTNVRFRT